MGGMPREAPSSPRAASGAGSRPGAFRRPQRGSAAKLRAFAGFAKGTPSPVRAIIFLCNTYATQRVENRGMCCIRWEW
jgi:hypothetical protein